MRRAVYTIYNGTVVSVKTVVERTLLNDAFAINSSNLVYTTVNKGALDNARVITACIRHFHKNWQLQATVCQKLRATPTVSFKIERRKRQFLKDLNH